MLARPVLAAALAVSVLSQGLASGAAAQQAKITPLMSKPIPTVAGAEKEGTMITVEIAPGAASAQHRHNAHVFLYVLQGAMIMQVKGGPEVTVKAGETFYENPDDIHALSKNASQTEPAKFLVFALKDKGAPLVVPVQ